MRRDDFEFNVDKISENEYELQVSIYNYYIMTYIGPVSRTISLNEIVDMDEYIDDLASSIGRELYDLTDEADDDWL